MFNSLIFRVVGSPPTPGATREQRLRWIRKFYRLNVAAVAMVVAFALLSDGIFLWILAAAGAVWWAAGWTAITRSIHREESNHTY